MRNGGFINLVFDENAPPPSELSPEQIDSRILGVILVNRYNLKKGKELFGGCCGKAVMAELSEIDGLETCEPQRINDLIYDDKDKHSSHYYSFLRKRLIRTAKRRSRVDVWQLGANSAPMMDTKDLMGRHRRSLLTASFSQESLEQMKTGPCP